MGFLIRLYRKLLIHRYDEDPLMKYFRVEDFPGLQADPVTFVGPHGESLKGFYYYHEHPKKGKLILLCHGLGAGHSAYMSEIETLAKQGYKVLAFDYVGCGLSEGKDTRAMSEPLADVDCVLNQLHTEDEIIVWGHSWGGYIASNIRNYHPEIKKVVVISAFLSVHSLLGQYLHGIASLGIPVLMRFERKANPKYADSSAFSAFDDDEASALWLHSSDDNLVSYKENFLPMREHVYSPNIEFISFNDRFHNPNYTPDAAKYLTETLGRYRKEYPKKPLMEKKAYLDSLDWKRMTAQDPKVWEKIFDFIEK